MVLKMLDQPDKWVEHCYQMTVLWVKKIGLSVLFFVFLFYAAASASPAFQFFETMLNE